MTMKGTIAATYASHWTSWLAFAEIGPNTSQSNPVASIESNGADAVLASHATSASTNGNS